MRSDPGAPRRAEYPSQSQGESPGYAGMPLRLDVHAVSGHGTVDVASVPNAPLPPRGADTIVAGMPERVGHRSRSLTLGDGGGAFIAFHGSWNRMPLPERGCQVVFVPFARGRPAGPYEAFADGFAGDTLEPILARHRPTGLAEAPDGALFISDDQRGRMWRVRYAGR